MSRESNDNEYLYVLLCEHCDISLESFLEDIESEFCPKCGGELTVIKKFRVEDL
jgi:rRNA maturation endonuclease Nob1